MRNLAQTLNQQSQSIGIDAAIGQIDLIGEAGEIVKSWRIRSPRCTLGSSPECSVQLTSPGIAPLHATLIFGKKHTLLRSSGPTLISNRHVREWLIDHSTEISVGPSRLIVHPSVGGATSVVHAGQLIDHAARLSKVQSSVIPNKKNPSAFVQTEKPSRIEVDSASDASKKPFQVADSSRLETIEQLLQSLHVSLDKLQTSLGSEPKISNDVIVESVSQEIDAFGKRLFTNLNDQMAKESGTQQSLIADLANQVIHRFGAIDDQLSRFSDATSKNTTTLHELLDQATDEQARIESRFQEVISHRDELMDAVQCLRSEIASAYHSGSGADFIDAQPQGFEHSNEEGFESYLAPSANETLPENAIYAAEGIDGHAYEETSPQYSTDSVSDDQLAYSLEQAQVQIQELNAQLRQLEMERDFAQQRVQCLAESWSNEQTTAIGSNANDQVAHDSETDRAVYETDEAIVEEKYAEEKHVEKSQQLPIWFLKEEPVEGAQFNEIQAKSFSPPDLRGYSDSVYASNLDYPSDTLERSERDDDIEESSEAKLDSMSDRLQRMLSDADQRRGPGRAQSELRTSSNWSQKFNTQPSIGSEASSDAGSTRENTYEVGSPDGALAASPQGRQLTDSLRDLYRQPIGDVESEPNSAIEFDDGDLNSVENRLSSFVSGQENRFPDVEPNSLGSLEVMERDEGYVAPATNSRHAQMQVGAAEEESIEDYMQRLLNRVRGGAEDAKATPVHSTPIPAKVVATPSANTSATKPRSRVAASMGLDMNDPETVPKVEKLSEELFMPRQQAPEKRNDLSALRELANTNARRAINRSDIQRINAAFIVKLGITCLAVASAVALYLFNGFELNPIFSGMVSAIVVAILWGYDCANHFRRLRNGNGMQRTTTAETAAGQSIRVGSTEETGWRPTEA